MKQPLVTRPPYAEGAPITPMAVAELPGGGPSDRGISLDPGIPGAATFSKPVTDVRKPDNKDESIYRVEDADSLTKDRGRIDVNEDSKDQSTGYMGLGKPDPATKTKYPYRDGVPNAHNASFVAELWKLEGARTRVLLASEKVRVAATMDQILTGLDPKFEQRSRACTATLKRVDAGNMRWIFAVDCGNGPKAVKIKAIPKAQNRQFAKLDLELSCSCPAWQWLGPEYHAKKEDYIIGKPRGTASTPDIKDPERDNLVCKHVAAALAQTRQWSLPKSKMQRAVKKAVRVRRALKRACDKRASNLQAATNAVAADPVVGWKVSWSEAPKETSTVYVRARGPVEDGRAKFQIRKEGEAWPTSWSVTQDLAGAMGRMGLDVGWQAVPAKVKAWLRG